MFYLTLTLALLLLAFVVAEPERWPGRLIEFIKSIRLHHG
jgi:hypothetical protein